MYVVKLIGENVFHNSTIVCTITKKSNLDRVRVYIKQKYGVEFEEVSAHSPFGCRYNNITDDRDIYLVVENVYTEDDVEKLIS